MSKGEEVNLTDSLLATMTILVSLLCGAGLGGMIQYSNVKELRHEIQLLKAKHNAEIEVCKAALRRNGQWAQQ